MPYPRKGETKEEFISRFMGSAEANRDYPDQKQRLAVAESLWREKKFNEASIWDKFIR